jgi:hypothetical protein
MFLNIKAFIMSYQGLALAVAVTWASFGPSLFCDRKVGEVPSCCK